MSDFTTIENIYLARLSLDENKSKALIDAKKLIKNLGLLNRENHLASELSGGEMQRVAIARALINSPEIILADEPTGNLDPVAAFELVQLLETINNNGTTILMASHNYNLIKGRGRRILELKDGAIRGS